MIPTPEIIDQQRVRRIDRADARREWRAERDQRADHFRRRLNGPVTVCQPPCPHRRPYDDRFEFVPDGF